MFYVVADSQGAKITKVTGNDPNEIIFKTMTGLINALKDRILANAVAKPAQEEAPSNEVVKSSTPLIISAVVLIIAIIASAAVAFYMKGKDDIPDVPETTAYIEEITEPETTTAEEKTEEETEEESEESTGEEEESSEETAE